MHRHLILHHFDFYEFLKNYTIHVTAVDAIIKNKPNMVF